MPGDRTTPQKAAFPFLHADGYIEAGREVQVFLLGEAVSLMRTPVANAVVPVDGRRSPILSEDARVRVPIHV